MTPCECCGKEAIGVFSTIIPYSTAFCLDCIKNNAEPRWIMDFIYTEQLDSNVENAADHVLHVTIFVDGEYLSFKDYIEKYPPKINP